MTRMTSAETFGKVIRARRKEMHYTQRFLSDFSGLSVSFISDLENAGFIPSVRERAKVVSDAVFAGKCTVTISYDPLFFEQTSYTLIAQANEGYKLEFNHENANFRKRGVPAHYDRSLSVQDQLQEGLSGDHSGCDGGGVQPGI